MVFMRAILLFTLAIVSGVSFGQNLFGRKDRALIDFNGKWKMSGWHFAPGITHQLTRFSNKEEAIEVDDDTRTITFDPAGKIGVYLEVGRYNIFYKGGNFFNYMDYSLAYKMLRGKEEYTGDLSGESKYSHNFLLGNFNINNVFQLSDYTFLQNSIGVNVDWRFSSREKGSPLSDHRPSSITGQIHYKIGYGIKATKRLFIIPQLEVPILNVHNFEKFKSTWGVFNSRYRPLILSVRFAWLRPVGKGACPKVDDPAGKAAQDAFQMR